MVQHCYDIADGTVTESAPDAPLPSEGFRWLHWDLADAGLGPFAARLPRRAAAALTQKETRPRAFEVPDDDDLPRQGLVLILRGVNFNPGELSEDMVSLRCFAGRRMLVTVRVRRVFSVQEVR